MVKGSSDGWAGQDVHKGASNKAMAVAAPGAESLQEGKIQDKKPRHVRATLKATATVHTATHIGRRPNKDGMKQLPMEGV